MIKIQLWGIFLFLVIHIKLHAQATFIEYPQVCDFIFTDDNGLIYLSSTRGLYVYDGSGSPKRIKLDGLDNSNIQSAIYPDGDFGFWFSTYNRIVRYNRKESLTESYQIVVSPGDTLISNYYIFDIDDDRNIIWVKENDKIFEHHTVSKTTRLVVDSIDGKRILVTQLDGTTFLLNYYFTFEPSIVLVERDACKTFKWMGWPAKNMAHGLVVVDSNTVLFGTGLGLLMGDIRQRKVEFIPFKEFEQGIMDIAYYTDQSWIVSTRDSHLYILTVGPSTDKYKVQELRLFPTPGLVNRILRNDQGTIYLSSYERGIYYFNPGNIKFSNYHIDAINELTSIDVDREYFKNSSMETEVTASGIPFIYNTTYALKSMPPYKHSILDGQHMIQHPDTAQLYRYFKDQNGDVFASFLDTTLYQFKTDGWIKVETPPAIDSYVNFYYNLGDTLHIASVDQEKIVTWSTGKESQPSVYNYSGDVYNGLYAANDNIIYLGTEQGLLNYNVLTHKFSLVNPNRTLPCFCVLQDRNADIWYSSINQVFRYSPPSDSTTSYDLADGARVYSPRKCNALSPDSLLFYYSDGVTLIQPSKIKPHKAICHVNFLNLKFNDILIPNSAALLSSGYIKNKFKENTISFDLVSNDLIDATHTRIKYTLKGYDQEWVYSDGNTAFVRYPRLPPGNYIFTAFGANSDGHWNEVPKEVKITIKPPFYLTWWFITLSTITLISILYLAIRSYYRRKLEKKNQLLREQALIIEKQQAVEHERTRIASEMHDDLGSGLTTIRYLSDKALAQVKNAEEASQIKKIADHSNALVRNMSEIIWAMNSRFDNAESLTGYLRRYASEYFEEYKMPLKFTATEEALDKIPLSGERRRNIFLVFKETLHNTIKYSQAHSVEVIVSAGKTFEVHITEAGAKGFDPEAAREKGNGLYNSRKRMAAIGGDIRYEKTPDAMHIIINVPLNTTSHVQT